MQEDDFQYYIDHQDELVNLYNGKYIAIKDRLVFGVYDTELEGYFGAQEHHELGTFILMHCVPGKESYTASFSSRVIF